MMKNSLTLLIFFAGITLARAQQKEISLLIGTYTGTGSKGIYQYRFNTATADANEITVTGGIENPSFLAVSPDKRFVYAVAEADGAAGMVIAYALKNGKLTRLNRRSSRGGAPCHVSVHPSGKWVTVANYSGGNFSVFRVNADGSLATAVQTIQHVGSGPDKSRQEKPHVHQTIFSPNGKSLLVNDLGLDKTFIYPFDAVQAKPVAETKVTTVDAKPGSGPRHLTFHPNGKLVFLITEMESAVSSFTYSNGKLLPVQTLPLLPDHFTGKTGAADIHVSPDGRFLYASNRLETNDISVFSIDASSGKMQFVQRVKTGGKDPRNFFIAPDGRYLLAANQNSNSITIFKVDKNTGKLVDTENRISVPKPVCIIRIN